jgi:hypothetical protein
MSHETDRASPPEDRKQILPPRLAILPLVALGLKSSVAKDMAARGIATVRDIAAHGADRLAPGHGLNEESVALLWSRYEALLRGDFDPTLSIAGTLPDELNELVIRAGIVRVDRTVGLLRNVRGLDGDRLTLDGGARKLGITRERARQIRNHAEYRIGTLIGWFEPRSLRLARETVARAGGSAPLAHVAWSVGLMMPPGSIDADNYCRWILGLAGDPGARLAQDSDIVTGPDPTVVGTGDHDIEATLQPEQEKPE